MSLHNWNLEGGIHMMVVESLSRTEKIGDITYLYNYRIIKSYISMEVEDDLVSSQAYGIEVERQDIVNGVVVNIERDSIESISPQRHKVHNLLRLLYDNAVSPIHLVEVLGEYVDTYIMDFDINVRNASTLN